MTKKPSEFGSELKEKVAKFLNEKLRFTVNQDNRSVISRKMCKEKENGGKGEDGEVGIVK